MNITVQLQKIGIILIRILPLKLADKIAAGFGLLFCYFVKHKREYIRIGRNDVHEKDIEHMTKATQVYTEISQYPGFKSVSCVDENRNLRTIEDIHQEILSIVRPFL